MLPLFLAVGGVVALGVAAAILRSFGPGYRVGRLLAVVARVPIAEALRLAETGESRYVRIDGRVDSDAEFEDADHRPLVLRRTTIDWRSVGARGAWTTYDTRLDVVPFVLREGLDEIAVEGEAIADGLVVVPRESVGQAPDLESLTEAGVDPEAEVRVRVEYVSTVDQATVLGVPVKLPDGRLGVGPGLGRPLILTTLEGDEAMRILTGGATGRSRVAVTCLIVGAVLIGVAAAWWLADSLFGGAAGVLAASPDPTLRPGSDTRSSGGGPGIVGDPLLALLGVGGIALLSLVASLAYVHFTGHGAGATHHGGGPQRPSR